MKENGNETYKTKLHFEVSNKIVPICQIQNNKEKPSEKWLYSLTLIIVCRLDELCRLDKKLSRQKKPGKNVVYTQKAAFRNRHNHAITS